ncbi:YggU family protein [Candidatus Woesearchaeota archaeon]|nr:YggU family protein [Candidatus Woesearchaeota archaeon]
MNIKDYIKNNSLKIVVKPNAKKNEILGYDKSRNAVKVAISAQAEKGRANLEVIKFFSKLLKKQVLIKSGLASKEKVLKIL